jgi:hypothetical protein
VNYNNDFKYDLELGQLGEMLIGKLLSSRTIEVKFDFGCYRTGNFYIEYQSRNKPSGIATTKADYWMLIAASEYGQRLKSYQEQIQKEDILYAVLIETERLKDLCRNKPYKMGVKGGDSNTSLGVLIKAQTLL